MNILEMTGFQYQAYTGYIQDFSTTVYRETSKTPNHVAFVLDCTGTWCG